MSITTSEGEEIDEKSVRTEEHENFKKSVGYQCLTKGHVWPEQPAPGDNKLICRRCGASVLFADDGDDEE